MRDGYGSKKFWFAIGVVLVGFAYAVLAATIVPELKPMFETYSGILEFVTGAYLVGNVANKWVVGKAEPTPAPVVVTKKTQALKAKEEAADPLDRDVPGGGA